MLDEIKLALRITHNALDTDIQRNIDSALLDLSRVGVDVTDQTNGLIIKACELYCKMQYDFDGKGEQFSRHYEKLRDSLSRAEDYREA